MMHTALLPSLSLIVTVVELGLPKVTSDGVPVTRANMTLKLSAGSLILSSTIGIVMLNRTVLAGIVIGWLVEAVKSAGAVANKEGVSE